MSNIKKASLFFISVSFIVTALFCISFMTVYADVGPKPGVELHIKNAPDKLYYVDLLVPYNYSELSGEYTDYNEEMISVLKNTVVDDLHPRSSGLGYIDDPIKASNSKHTYHFIYDIPTPFRVILVTEDLQTYISQEIDPYAYNSVITFDVKGNGKLTENYNGTVFKTIITFCITFLFTVLIEGIVFLCFRMFLKKNGYMHLYLLMNLLTQLFLYAVLNLNIYIRLLDLHIIMIAEVIITAAETIVFAIKMDKYSKRKIAVCTITANVISALMSVPVFLFLMFLRVFG